MAHRAFLFASDESDPPARDPGTQVPHYQSRWSIPVAWFLFFVPGDVRIRDAGRAGGDAAPGDAPDGGAGGEGGEAALAAARRSRVVLHGDRELGLARFDARRRLLSGRFPLGEVDYGAFLAGVRALPGAHLVVDLHQIERDRESDAEQAARFVDAIRALDEAREDAFFERVKRYLGDFPSNDEARLELSVVGAPCGVLAAAARR